jgi:phenylacetate-CoA ligase
MILDQIKGHILFPIAEIGLKRRIIAKYKFLKEFENESSIYKKKYSEKKLIEIIQYAEKKVPYYRDLFRKIHFQSSLLLKDINYIQDIPLTTKAIIQNDENRLISEDFRENHQRHQRKTNGSTGLITNVYYDQEGLDWTSAVNLFVSHPNGKNYKGKEIHLSSLMNHLDENSASEGQFSYWRNRQDIWKEKIKCWSLNRKNLYTQILNEKNFEELYLSIRNLKPYNILGHPTTLFHLAQYLQDTEQQAKGLFKVFESTGELLDSRKLEKIKRVFGCQVYNRYGNAEFGVMAYNHDGSDQLDILRSIVFAESHSCGNGLDELVMTGLTNFAMPLIRYKVGDIGCVNKEGSKIQGLSGRIHDTFVINNNLYSSDFVKDVLERIGGFDDFQIIDRGEDKKPLFKIILQQAQAQNEIFKAHILKTFDAYFGAHNFEIQYIDFSGLILQGWRDKFRYVVKNTI